MPRKARPTESHKRRTLLIVLGGIAAVLVGLRLLLPHWVLATLNDRLMDMGEYRGFVADVDIHLWRGAYSLHKLVIEKSSGKVPVPLLNAPLIDIAVSWHALFRGSVVAQVHFDRPELMLVDGGDDADSQSGRGVDWRRQLENLLPIRLDELVIHDGLVGFRNFHSKPPVDVRATQVEARIDNLTNARRDEGARPAVLTVQANVLDGAPLTAEARFDPLADFNEFGLDLQVKEIDLPRLNDLFRVYSKLDVKSGTGDLVLQLEAKAGRVSGYAKPLFRDIELIEWKEDRKNPLRLAWEMVATTLATVFKNRKTDQLATRIDFEGTVADPKVETLDAILGILHNAFVKALGSGFEQIKAE
jgi:hypothetical protein